MTILVTLLVSFLVSAAILKPFLAPASALEGGGEDLEIEQLRDRRSRSLQMLRDLDFDHATGKVADTEYERMRASLVSDLSAILRRLKQER